MDLIKYSNQTPELCKTAVEKEPLAIEFVDEKFLNDELISLALSKDINVLKFIPTSYISNDVIKSLLA